MEKSEVSPDIITKLEEEKTLEGVLCGVCHRQFSRYSCPRCNLAYCSLPCFRSEAHGSCSESFYRTQLETDIRSAPSKSIQERKDMMDLLKRFEEESLQDEVTEEEGDEDELERKLQAVDLGKASYEELWELLKPDQRTKFMNAMQDPSSSLARDLMLASGESDGTTSPWWESNTSNADFSTVTDTGISPHIIMQPARVGEKPQLMSIPASWAKQYQQQTFSLAYNLVAILLAYAYTTRHLSASPLSHSESTGSTNDARRILCRLVPFIADKRSTTRLSTLENVVTDVWSRFEPGSMDSQQFSALLKDVAYLLRPVRVAVLDSTSTATPAELSPNTNVLLALSDAYHLFSGVSSPTSTPLAKAASRMDPIAAKLAFYAGQVLSTEVDFFDGLAEEVGVRAARESD